MPSFPTTTHIQFGDALNVTDLGSGQIRVDGQGSVGPTGATGPQGPAGPAGTGGMVKLFDSLLGADAASIDTGAGGVAAGYACLEVRMFVRTDEASDPGQLYVRLNNDSTAIYDWQRAGGSNVTAIASTINGDTGWACLCASSSIANNWGAVTMSIPNYDNTLSWKAATWVDAYNVSSGSGRAFVRGGLYRSASAVSRIAVTCLNPAQKLRSGSRMTVWGA